MSRKRKIIIIGSIIVVLLLSGGIFFKLYYDKMVVRNHALYETKEVVADPSYHLSTVNNVYSDTSIFDALNMDWIDIHIPISVKTNNYKVDGYQDLNVNELDIHLDSDAKIEYVEPSNELKTLEIVCYGDDTHDLLDFTEYFPNITSLLFYDCNFPDNYEIKGENVSFIHLEGNTNVDYSTLINLIDLSSIYIDDDDFTSGDIDFFPESVNYIRIYMKHEFNYDLNDLPSVLEYLYISTNNDSDNNLDTLYNLEDYPNLEQFDYNKAEYITQESYDYVIENDIVGISEDIEILE